jgi:hypothetical protein
MCCSTRCFSKGGDIGVVAYIDGYGKGILQDVTERDIMPPRQIGRRNHHTRCWVERTRRGYTDTRDSRPILRPDCADKVF